MYKYAFSRVVLPPEENVIQGLMQPEFKPKPKPRRIRPTLQPRRRPNRKMVCDMCDFRDKQNGSCLIKRLGGVCPYLNGGNGYVVFRFNGRR